MDNEKKIRLWLIELLNRARYHFRDGDEEMGKMAIAWLKGQDPDESEGPVLIKVPDGSQGEMIRNSLVALVKDDGIHVGGRFTKQDIIDWIEKKENTKHYNIWMEGFSMTGESAQAEFVGTYEANSFEEACQKAFGKDPYYNPKQNTYYGCGLYDNEADARKSFG